MEKTHQVFTEGLRSSARTQQYVSWLVPLVPINSNEFKQAGGKHSLEFRVHAFRQKRTSIDIIKGYSILVQILVHQTSTDQAKLKA